MKVPAFLVGVAFVFIILNCFSLLFLGFHVSTALAMPLWWSILVRNLNEMKKVC